MEKLYEIIYGKLDPPLYVPRIKVGNVKVGDILDFKTLSYELKPKIVSLRIDKISKEYTVNKKKLITVNATPTK